MLPFNISTIQSCMGKTLLFEIIKDTFFYFFCVAGMQRIPRFMKDFIFNSCWALASQIKAMFVSMLLRIVIHVKSSVQI